MTNTTYTNTTYTTTSSKSKLDFADIWETVSTVCAFLPLITSLAWALYAIPGMPINLFLACLFGGAGACALVALLAFAPGLVTLVNFFKGE